MSTSRGTSGTSSNRLHVEDDDADGVDDVYRLPRHVQSSPIA